MQVDKEEIRKALYRVADIQCDAIYDAFNSYSSTGVPDEEIPQLMTSALTELQSSLTAVAEKERDAFRSKLQEYKNGK